MAIPGTCIPAVERLSDITALQTAAGLLGLQQLPRVGPTTALRAALAGGISPRLANNGSELAGALAWAEAEIERHRDAGVEVIGFFDERYPRRLAEIPDPPPVLFARGNLALLSHPRPVAVVGTREPSTFGETATREIVRALAGDGWSIVSGLARGVDAIAHQEALDHGAPAIVILGNGLDRVYPKANERLAGEILAAEGLLLAELPFGEPAIARNLIARDRLQSGISAAVIVSQTGLKGGAMHTARYAAEQARPLFCPVPHGENGKSEGLRALLQQPASELHVMLPAWREARALCRRLGSRTIARPIERETLSALLEELDVAAQHPTDLGQQQLLFAATNA